jgi:hypothetical protein
MTNIEQSELNDWKNTIVETIQWLNNLKTAISTNEYKKLHGNIERIERIAANLDYILTFLKRLNNN